MKKKIFFLLMALLFCFSTMNTTAFAAERSVYQEKKSSRTYMELWEVTSENVDSLNKNFAKLLSEANGIEQLNVPYEGKITLDFLKELAGDSEGPIYQGYARLNIEGSKEGYVFSTTIEKNKSGNFKVKGWYVDINGELITEFEREMNVSSYNAYIQQNAIKQAESNSTDDTNNNQTVSVFEEDLSSSSTSSNSTPSDPTPPAPSPTPNPSPNPPTPPAPPVPPTEGETGITEPEPGETIPGPTMG